ncbi:MAG: SAM-dependent methyltransferase [Verrucomicrobiota bacterium JB022]|nr:SAM-dependent methyltransferase [Verrucomicrobiota bacterium JB022]
MWAALEARADAQGRLSYRDFIEVTLYTPEVGYYRQPAERVGRQPGSDFYTSTSLGPIFAELVVAAAVKLLPEAPAHYTFVEIAAEPDSGLLHGREHPFADYLPLRLGQELNIPPRSVVFANEWLDAQPFDRLVFREGAWRERAVQLQPDATLAEIELGRWDRDFPALAHPAPEGYELDLPLDAVQALESIARQDWQGLFITCDYGLLWNALAYERPAGTARTYSRHQQGDDLLERPGEIDITCHVCWDWLEQALRDHRFDAHLERQEAFLVQHGTAAIERAMRESRLSRGALQELLHPQYFGSKFQVLWGSR